MARYTQNFTLEDIFNNKALKDKLPLINYKEIEREDGKISQRTSPKTVTRQIFDTAESAAKPYYKPLKAIRKGQTMDISGELVGDYDTAVDAIYNALLAKRAILIWTANNTDMIRDAVKEAGKNKMRLGINSKLWLRAQSMKEIEGMTRPQIQALLGDIMENIFYSDNFPKTQAKYGVYEDNSFGLTYNQRKEKWKNKVGDL